MAESGSLRRVLMAASGLAAVVTFAFLRALEDQISRLHVPLAPSHGYNTLHGTRPGEAVASWWSGARALIEFGAMDPRAIVRVHVAVDVLFAGFLGAFLILVLIRLRLPKWLGALVVAGATATVVEGFLELAIVDWFQPATARYHTAFTVLSAMRIMFPLVVIVVASAVAIRRGGLGRAGWYCRTASATSRLILAAAIGFALVMQFGDIGAQAEDLLRRELAIERLGRGILFLALYIGVLAVVRRIVVSPGDRPSWLPITLWGAGITIAGVAYLTVGNQGSSVAVLGALLLVVGVASASVSGQVAAEATDADDADKVGYWLYVWAGILPLIGIALVAARLLAAEVATNAAWVPLVFIVVFLVAGAVGVFIGFTPGPEPDPASSDARATYRSRVQGFPRLLTGFLGVVVLAVIVLGVAQAFSDRSSFAIGDTLGSFGVLLLGLAAFAAAGGLVRLIGGDVGRPAIFVWFNTLRTPVVALLLVWILVVNLGTIRFEDAPSSPHVVRDHHRTEGLNPPCEDPELSFGHGEVALAFCNWLVENVKVHADAEPGRGPVPLILASASGGGVRAAAWTARVLDCLFLATPKGKGEDPCKTSRPEPRLEGTKDNWSLLFAAGGASGGSVGIVTALAHKITKSPRGKNWIRRFAGEDHVSRVLARMVLAELPLAPTGYQPGTDRAELLIDSWADTLGSVKECGATNGRPLSDVGFLELRRDCHRRVPLLMLNGTVVSTGKRFDISPLNLSTDPGLRDVLCADEDVRLFDAAFLSARFPFVTPSGHFLKGDKKRCWRNTTSAVEVVDGGYAENSGAAQIGALWSKLHPLVEEYNARRPEGFPRVRPVFLQIENGERKADALGPVDIDAQFGASVGEPFKPLAAGFAARVGGGIEAEAMKKLLAELERTGVPIVTTGLYPHPGRRLPLGWALTPAILDDIDDVFQLCPNEEAAKDFRAYVNGDKPKSPQPRTRDGVLAGSCP